MPAFGHVAQSLLVLLKRVTHRLTDACQLWLSVFADLKATRIREASEKAVQIRNFMLFFVMSMIALKNMIALCRY